MVYLLSPGDCCDKECSCTTCAGTQSFQMKVTLANFTGLPNGDYIVTCITSAVDCLWVHIVSPTACGLGVDLMRLGLITVGASLQWQWRLINSGTTVIWCSAVSALLPGPVDCQVANFPLSVVLGSCFCAPTSPIPTVHITAL